MEADLQIAFSLRDRRFRGEDLVVPTTGGLDSMLRTPQASYRESCFEQCLRVGPDRVPFEPCGVMRAEQLRSPNARGAGIHNQTLSDIGESPLKYGSAIIVSGMPICSLKGRRSQAALTWSDILIRRPVGASRVGLLTKGRGRSWAQSQAAVDHATFSSLLPSVNAPARSALWSYRTALDAPMVRWALAIRSA